MKILAISGSVRKASTNTMLLKMIKSLSPKEVELSVFSRLNALPIFSSDFEGKATPTVVLEFLKMISTADALIISSPEYVRTIPGGLKNAIDWMVSLLKS